MRLTLIRRAMPAERLAEVDGTLAAQLAGCGVAIPAGARIAVAVGSRGIAELPRLVRGVVAWVRAQGGAPFILPAMGSHGGATADGQRAVLAGYGVTEAAVGAPVVSRMAVTALPQGDAEVPVVLADAAARADGIIVLNRVKPHTSFRGRYESGLMKMLAVGLGQAPQARAIHALGVRGLREVMPQVARQVLRHAPVLLGVAVVENARDELLCVQAIPAARIPEAEPALLELARRHRPGLPVDALDLLIVDRIGKDISGLGMDPHVIGRLGIRGEPEPASPRIGLIYVRGLTPATHGNACGMGLADLISRRAWEQIDRRATYANVLTTGCLERGKTPLIAEHDGDALAMAAGVLHRPGLQGARVLRLADTLHLEALLVSEAVLAELAGRPEVTVGASVEAFAEVW